jgi:hypothetical protein
MMSSSVSIGSEMMGKSKASTVDVSVVVSPVKLGNCSKGLGMLERTSPVEDMHA